MKAFMFLILAICGIASADVWTQYPVSVGTSGVASVTLDGRFYPPAVLDSMWTVQPPLPRTSLRSSCCSTRRNWDALTYRVVCDTNAASESILLVNGIGLVVKTGDTLTISNAIGAASVILNVKRSEMQAIARTLSFPGSWRFGVSELPETRASLHNTIGGQRTVVLM